MIYEIIPSPGTQDHDWLTIEKKIETVKPFVKTVHIDILDGKFAPNVTSSDPQPFKKFTNDIFFEVHLMVDEPINYIDSFAKAGFKRFIGHVEMMSDQDEFIRKGKTLGEVGLAIDKDTSINAITMPFENLDTLLVMTIQAGFSGQVFLPELLEKVKALREKCNLPIEVDGGINDLTILKAKEAGANRFVTTSHLFNSLDHFKTFSTLLEKIK